MYEVKVSEKQISWLQPNQFRLAEQFNRRLAIRRYLLLLVIPYLVLMVGTTLIISLANTHSHPFVAFAIVWIIAFAVWLPGWLALRNVYPTRNTRLIVSAKKLGVVGWRDVNWWRLANDEKSHMYRILEAEVTWLFGRKTLVRRWAFDPTELDENTLLAFLRRIAPEKELAS